jgi:Calcineurin-like phosphoesterase
MNIAVFADVHGRILLCFTLCARWEQETGEKIDLILQAGDLGAFPDVARLDKATIKHAQNDPTELGFLNDFLHPQPEVAVILGRTTCNLIFVRGNHEDQLWLDTLEQQADAPIFPVDAYQRLYCLKTGIPYAFSRGEETLTVLGIGRIGLPDGADTPKPKHIQPHELDRLYSLEQPPDVLLTHDSAKHVIFPGSGMDEIRLILDRYQPGYHFFGHYGGPCLQGTDANGKTSFCKLADLAWDQTNRGKVIEPGAMGLLRWENAAEHRFEVIDQPWLKEYNAFTWRYV